MDQIEALIDKAVSADTSEDAMRFSQAALNAANALSEAASNAANVRYAAVSIE